MTFSPAELAYLREQQVGRLCTIGPAGEPQIRPVGVYVGPDGITIEIVGHALAQTQKWRNVIRNPRVAIIVDNVISVQPPNARGIEVRGVATTLPGQGSTQGGLAFIVERQMHCGVQIEPLAGRLDRAARRRVDVRPGRGAGDVLPRCGLVALDR